MSIVQSERIRSGPHPDQLDDCRPTRNGRLHRIQAVRKQQGLSLRAVARQTGTEVQDLRMQEEESADLSLSDLYRWQEALDVPIEELLEDPGTSLSPPVMKRAQMLRLMKTAVSINESADAPGLKRMAQMLVDQLVELMPELSLVNGWHTVGQRRSLEEYGQVVERSVPDDTFYAYRPD